MATKVSPAGGTGKYAGLSAAQKWAKNPHHTISFATHEQNAQAKAALGGSLDLTAPPNGVQAVREANSAADLQFGPQVQQAQQLQTNVAPWFHNYMATVAGIAQAAQTQMNPVLAQAQAYQTGAAAQVTPGLDPNSDAGKQAAQAAQGRQALAQLGLDAENTTAQATQDYFGGQQAMAAQILPQQQAAAAQALANAQSQRGAAVQGFLTTARQNAQNYAIARGTLNLNSDKANADTLTNAGYDPVTGKKLPAKAPSASDQKTQAELDYFDKHGYWPPTGPPTKPKGSGGLTPAQKQAAKVKEQTRVAGVRADSGKVLAKVDDTIGAWNTIASRQILTGNVQIDPDTKKPKTDSKGNPIPKLGANGKPETAKATPDYVRNQLLAQGYDAGMIHVALLRRVGKPLDQAAVDYLHAKGVRIPREWLPYDPSITAGSKNDPKGGAGANP